VRPAAPVRYVANSATIRMATGTMNVRLRSAFHEGMSMPALISLRDELDGMLQRIRTGRNVQTLIVTCGRCGTTGSAAEPHVSVRALILAVAQFSESLQKAKPAPWKRRGQNTASNTGWTLKGKSRRGLGSCPH
jgi:hypothetical protein